MNDDDQFWRASVCDTDTDKRLEIGPDLDYGANPRIFKGNFPLLDKAFLKCRPI